MFNKNFNLISYLYPLQKTCKTNLILDHISVYNYHFMNVNIYLHV
jgi:hypothetical protein